MTKDFLPETTIYAPHKTYASVLNQIQNFAKNSNKDLRIVVFLSNKDVIKLLLKSKDSVGLSDFHLEVQHSTGNIMVGEMSRRIGLDDPQKVSGRFTLFRYQDHNVYIFVTDENAQFEQECLVKFVRNNYPDCLFPFIYSWEMELMLDKLCEVRPKHQIRLTKILSKSRLIGLESRKQKESDLKWTDIVYKEGFVRTKENDAWVEKLKFDLTFTPEKKTSLEKVMTGYISRDGIFRCNKDFKLFYETIMETGISMFLTRNEKFSNRARVKETKFESKPLCIQFDEPVLKSKEQRGKLLNVLKNFKHSANSVIHGNPYLHLVITDSLDNSSYDVWVLSDTRVSIVPQTVCTNSSLNRLCNHISKEFQEGEIKDLKEVS